MPSSSSRKRRDEEDIAAEGGTASKKAGKRDGHASRRVSHVLDQAAIRGESGAAPSDRAEQAKKKSKKRSREEDSSDSGSVSSADSSALEKGAAKKGTKTENVHKRQRNAGQVSDAQTATLYIWGFPFETDIEEFVKGSTDGVTDVRVHTWHDSGKSRGCAHVDYESEEHLETALKELDRKQVGERYVRAERAKDQTFAPPPKEDGSRCCRRLFAKNLPYEATEDGVRELFAQFGGVKDVRIPLDFPSKRPKGFCYVEFLKLPDAIECMKAHRDDPIALQGRKLQLDYAPGEWKRSKPKAWNAGKRNFGGKKDV